jgi:hypothetical protein
MNHTAAAASSLSAAATPQAQAVPRAWWTAFDQSNREKMRTKLYAKSRAVWFAHGRWPRGTLSYGMEWLVLCRIEKLKEAVQGVAGTDDRLRQQAHVYEQAAYNSETEVLLSWLCCDGMDACDAHRGMALRCVAAL